MRLFLSLGEYKRRTPIEHSFVLGVDLDGVCGDHNLIFRDIVAKELGVEPKSLTLDRSWGFEEWGLSISDFEKVARESCRRAPHVPGYAGYPSASEVLWRLSDQGFG